MQSRIVVSLGALASAALLMTGVAVSAQAATGTLIVDGVDHRNPSGCFNLPNPRPGEMPDDLVVKNNTDKLVVVWANFDCNAHNGGNTQVSTIEPEAEASVRVDRSISVE